MRKLLRQLGSKWKDPPKKTAGPDPVREEAEGRLRLFQQHLDADLAHLGELLSGKRDIRQDISRTRCLRLLRVDDWREGYRSVAAYLQEFSGLNEADLQVVWEPLPREHLLHTIAEKVAVLGAAYRVPMGDRVSYSIYLNPAHAGNPGRLLAALAHELAHVYAHRHHLRFVSTDDARKDAEHTEEMTDLLGITLGLGPIMGNLDDTRQGQGAGHLTDEMVSIAHRRWRSEFVTGKRPGMKTTVTCPRCAQRLRIPIRQQALRVTCSRCQHVFEDPGH